MFDKIKSKTIVKEKEPIRTEEIKPTVIVSKPLVKIENIVNTNSEILVVCPRCASTNMSYIKKDRFYSQYKCVDCGANLSK